MKAILWKEVRENLKWAVLGGIAFAVALAYSLNQLEQTYRIGSFSDNGVMNCRELSTVLLFGPIFIGFALGLLQIVPELKRDQWAFLIHRPVHIKTIFWGKVTAGFLLYFGATILPFSLAAGWTVIPGNYPAPFDFHPLLPGIADILCGAVFYLAGITVALRDARWFGTKLAPVLAACFCATRVTDTDFFSVALLWIAFFAALLALLACGIMTQGSRYSLQSKSVKFAGILCLLFAAFAVCVAIKAGYQKIKPEESILYRGYEQYEQDLQGKVVIVKWAKEETEVRNLDGSPILKDGKVQKFSYGDFMDTQHLTRNRFPESYRSGKEWVMQMRNFQDHAYDPDQQELLWYYVAGEGIFEGFSQRSCLLEELITPQGFQSPNNPVKERFQDIHLSDAYQNPLLWFGEQVVFVDVERKRVSHIFTSQPPQKILGVAAFKNRSQNLSLSERYSICVATDQGLEFFDTKGQLYTKSPWPMEGEEYICLGIGKDKPLTHFYVWQYCRNHKMLGYYLTSIPINGEPPVTQWLPSLKEEIAPITLPDYFAVTTDSPLMIKGIRWHNVTPSIFYTFCSMLIGYFVMRKNRFSKRKTFGWCSFIFLAGPMGLIAFLLARDWPVKIKCPSCGKQREIGSLTCDFCKAPWPEPARDGTEIFERDASKQVAGSI